MSRETKAAREQREAAEATENAQPEPAPTEAEAQPQVNAVVVTRVFDAEGKVAVEVSNLGDVRLTEVQTILELGLGRFRELALGQKPG